MGGKTQRGFAMSCCDFAPLHVFLFIVVALGVAATAVADDVTVETVLTDLGRPSSIAARPGGTADRYELFIADADAGRVVRWSSREPDGARDVILGLPVGVQQRRGLPSTIGLIFLDPGLLVVAGTSPSDAALLRVYELPDGSSVLGADSMTQARTCTLAGYNPADGQACFAVTRTLSNEFVRDMLVITIAETDRNVQLLSSRIQAGILAPLRPFASHTSARAESIATALATSSTGRIVTVRIPQERQIDQCELLFYSPLDGSVELAVATDLHSVCALAYSPITGSLCAAGSTSDSEEQGIFRIDDASEPGRPASKSVRIAKVSGAVAMAFAPDGALFVSTLESGTERGKLLMLAGNL